MTGLDVCEGAAQWGRSHRLLSEPVSLKLNRFAARNRGVVREPECLNDRAAWTKLRLNKDSEKTNGIRAKLPRGCAARGDRRVVETFVRAIETTKRAASDLDLMQILAPSDCPAIIMIRKVIRARAVYETGDHEEPDDCDS